MTWLQLDPKEPNRKDEQQKQINQKKNRIVQTQEGEKLAQPPKDAFLGWQNQKFEHQTVSKNKMTVQGAKPKEAHSPSEKDKKQQDQKEQNLDQTLAKAKLSDFGVQMIPSQERQTGYQSDSPDWATPGTRPNDHVAGLEESNQTALNTQEYRFYSYFQRIKGRLDHAWVPILRQKLLTYFRTGRKLASDIDHVTRVVVVLNEKGEVVRVKIVGESGSSDLDDAATRAFSEAGPFPNPPKGMADSKHEIEIPWDFVLKS